jgi:MFS family permease
MSRISLTARASSALIVFIGSLFFFYGFGLNNIFNVLEPYLSEHYNIPPTVMGLVSSLYFYANMLFLIPAGLLLDRYSPKMIILVAMGVCTLGTYLIAVGDNMLWVIIGRLLMGAGSGFCFGGAIRIAVNWVNPKRMGIASGFIVTMGMLGGYCVQGPLSGLIIKVGWMRSLWWVAMIGLIIIASMIIILRSSPAKNSAKKSDNNPDQNINNTNIKSQTSVSKCLKTVLFRRYNWLCGLYASMMNLPIYLLGALWGIPYLERVDHFSFSVSAQATGLLFLGTMFGAMWVGVLSDWLKNRLLVMKVGAFLSIIAFVLLITVRIHEAYFVDILFFVLGLVTSTQVLAYPMVVVYNGAKYASTATSIISMMCLGTGALAQPIFGWMMTLKGSVSDSNSGIPVYSVESYQFAISILLVTFIIGFIVSFLIKNPDENLNKSSDIILN